MEKENQPALFESIPADVLPVSRKPKRFTNCLAEIINEITHERQINLAKIHRETEIPFPTIDDWARGKSIPVTDENIMVLARYLNLDLEYLLYGIGSEQSLSLRVCKLAKYFNVDEDFIYQIMNSDDLEEDQLAV